MWKRRLSVTDLLILGNVALFIFLFVQIPRLTRVRLVFQPRVPTGLSTGPVFGVTDPRRDLEILEGGNMLGGFSRSNLIDSQRIHLPPAKVLPDGLQFRFSDPLLSLGVQRIAAFGMQGRLNLNLTVGEASDLPDSQPRVIRVSRDCPQRGGPVNLSLGGVVQAGRNQTLVVDTTPVWFLVPDASWDAYVSDKCQVSYSGLGTLPKLFGDSRPPRGGVDLSYAIEDELTGAPLPPSVAVTVVARAIDDVAVHGVTSTCRESIGRVDMSCFRRLNDLPGGRCAEMWPVTVDKVRSVIHVSRADGSPPACDLVLSVILAQGDGPVHVAFLELFDSPREAP